MSDLMDLSYTKTMKIDDYFNRSVKFSKLLCMEAFCLFTAKIVIILNILDLCAEDKLEYHQEYFCFIFISAKFPLFVQEYHSSCLFLCLYPKDIHFFTFSENLENLNDIGFGNISTYLEFLNPFRTNKK